MFKQAIQNSVLGATLIATTLSGITAFATATPNNSAHCRCEQFIQFVTQVNLVDEFTAIGTRALEVSGSAQTRATDARMIDRLRIMSNEQIPRECRNWVADHYQRPGQSEAATGAFVLRGQVTLNDDGTRISNRLSINQDASQHATDLFNLYFNNYRSYLYYGVLPNSGCATNDTNCRANAALSRFSDYEGVIRTYSQAGLPRADVDTILFFHRMLATGDINRVMADVRAGRDGLNEDQYLTAIQMLGVRLGNADYNFTRANDPDRSHQGILPQNQVLAGISRNIALGAFNSRDQNYEFASQLLQGGVCRDIVVTMASLLEAKGFQNVHTVGFSTVGGGHATVLAESYSNPGVYHLLNYGARSDRSGLDGAQLLHQGAGDATDVYDVYDARGNLQGHVPSQLGLIANEAAGMNNSDWYPLSRTRGSLISTNIGFARDRGQLRFFYATDSYGTPLIGLGTSLHLGDANSIAQLQAGGTVGVQVRNPQTTGDYGTGVQLFHVYGAVQGDLRTPRFRMGPALTSRLGVQGRANVQAHVTMDQYGTSDWYSHNQFAAIAEARLQAPNNGPSIESRSSVHTSIAVQNLQDGSLGGYGVSVPQFRQNILATIPVNVVRLYTQAQLIVDRLGTRGAAEIGVIHPNVGASVGVSGRFDQRGSLAAEGSLRRFTARIQTAPTQNLRAGAQVSVPLEQNNANTAEGIEAQATVNVNFKRTR